MDAWRDAALGALRALEALQGVHAVDAVIALVVIEAAVLALHHRVTGRGVAPRDVAATLLAGLLLMVALRAALGGAPWGAVALPLAGAGIAHAVDLRRRWRRRGPFG